MPLGENSYSFLLANKNCLQLRDMPNSDSYYKPWVGVEGGEGSKTRRKKILWEGWKRDKTRERWEQEMGFQLSPWIVLSALNMKSMCWSWSFSPIDSQKMLGPLGNIFSRSSLKKQGESSCYFFTTWLIILHTLKYKEKKIIGKNNYFSYLE